MKEYNTFQEFFNDVKPPKGFTRSFDNESIYFEFQPYLPCDKTIIKGWIKGVDVDSIEVSFAYNSFSLGNDTWDLEKANKYITHIDAWFEDNDEE